MNRISLVLQLSLFLKILLVKTVMRSGKGSKQVEGRQGDFDAALAAATKSQKTGTSAVPADALFTCGN